MLMFWLMSIYACILFNKECVCMSGCVCACVCLLHDLQCVCVCLCVCVSVRVLSCGMLQGHVHGPVM